MECFGSPAGLLSTGVEGEEKQLGNRTWHGGTEPSQNLTIWHMPQHDAVAERLRAAKWGL